MSEATTKTSDKHEHSGSPAGGEPGLMDQYGSFPVWLLRAIDLVTPDILKKSVPAPKHDKPRS